FSRTIQCAFFPSPGRHKLLNIVGGASVYGAIYPSTRTTHPLNIRSQPMRPQWPEYLSGPSVPGREGRYTTLTETNCWFANRPAVARDFYSRLTPAQTGSDRRD